MLRFGMPNQKESAAMKCLRIYATPDGESHFGEVELPTTKRSVHPDAVPFEVSASYQASRVRLTRRARALGAGRRLLPCSGLVQRDSTSRGAALVLGVA
jgi:hypothetical protein